MGCVCVTPVADAFTASRAVSSPSFHQNRSPSSSQLQVGNIFGDLFGQKEEKKQGPKTVVDISASKVKIAPLKFFLQIYLVAEQNTPTKGSWVINNNDENRSLDVYYKDGTGMFSVGIDEKSIKILRYGESPSLEYMLQESALLHGVLDELNQIAFEVDDIAPEKRLLQFDDDNVLNKARENLPARKA